MTDKELEQIYNEAYKAVYWTAMALLKNEADAEDIVQDTFVSLIESYDSIKDKSKVTAWLKKNAANKCLNRLTRTKTDNVEDEFFDSVEAIPEDFLPDSIVESEDARKIVMDIINNVLSEDVRRTLILFYFDEMSTKEIAEALGIPQGTVLWRLNFAKKKIKKEVEKYEKENNTKLFGMAIPFLSKLFIKEAEQVVFKPMPASLINLSASSEASRAGTNLAKTAIKKGTDIMTKKALIGIAAGGAAAIMVTTGIILGVAGKKTRATLPDADESTPAADLQSVQSEPDVHLMPGQEIRGYFIVQHNGDEIELIGITDEGKQQETLVIPAYIDTYCSVLKDCKVKHISFESDDDIDIGYFLAGSSTIESIELPANLKTMPQICNCTALKEITIPKEITVLPVTCLANDTALETVRFEGNLTEISNQAFLHCSSLKNIDFPDSVTIIGDWAFEGCTSLTEITLPAGLKVLGRKAFTNDALETVIIPEGLEPDEWDDLAFVTYGVPYTVKVKPGSWADTNFDEEFLDYPEKVYY